MLKISLLCQMNTLSSVTPAALDVLETEMPPVAAPWLFRACGAEKKPVDLTLRVFGVIGAKAEVAFFAMAGSGTSLATAVSR